MTGPHPIKNLCVRITLTNNANINQTELSVDAKRPKGKHNQT